MDYEDGYLEFFDSTISKKLPSSFVRVYNRNNWFHDWYLVSFYLANTGSLIQNYSKPGRSTVQIELSNTRMNVLLTYVNVTSLTTNYKQTNDVSRVSYTGFGECLYSKFELVGDSQISHTYEFLCDNTISIQFESLQYRRIRRDYF